LKGEGHINFHDILASVGAGLQDFLATGTLAHSLLEHFPS
jgi:hypothetical protein